MLAPEMAPLNTLSQLVCGCKDRRFLSQRNVKSLTVAPVVRAARLSTQSESEDCDSQDKVTATSRDVYALKKQPL